MTTLEKLLKDLIAIPSVSGDFAAADKVISYVEMFCQKLGNLYISRRTVNGYPSLMVTTQKTADRDTVWSIMHLDVVPGSKQIFSMTKQDGKLFGRGALDMKGVAAATLEALKEYDDRSKANLGFLFTTDEEIGGQNGAGAYANTSFKGAVCLVLDAGAHWTLEEQARGILHIRVSAAGKAAHGARPWRGESATEKVVLFFADLRSWFTRYYGMADGLDYDIPSLNLGVIRGGQAANQVSETCEMLLDLRFSRHEQHTRSLKKLNELAKKHRCKVEVVMSAAPTSTDMDDPHIRQFQKILEARKLTATGEEALAFGGTDGRYFNAIGIPTIITRPPGGDQHSEHEWVSSRGLEQLKEALKDYWHATA